MGKFIIGVTGRRALPPELSELKESVLDFLREVKSARPGWEIALYSSLAEGADSLCAAAALELGLKLIAPLPMSAPEYRKTISPSARAEFDRLLAKAREVFTVPVSEPAPRNPAYGFFYRQAGIYIAKNCDILLALWDGRETATPDGAGTWETIKLARQFGKEVYRIDI